MYTSLIVCFTKTTLRPLLLYTQRISKSGAPQAGLGRCVKDSNQVIAFGEERLQANLWFKFLHFPTVSFSINTS